MERYFGEVVWFSNKKGYGFLNWTKNGQVQKDMFVHFSDVDCEGFKSLEKNQKVSFELGTNFNGIDKAIKVKIL
jgi:CspA family cold shock protein